MTWRLSTALLAALLIVDLHPGRAQPTTAVSIELALAVDTSQSVDGFEFSLVTKGIAEAFRDAEVVARIVQLEGLAVTLFQWSSAADGRYAIPWRLIADEESALAFAAAVENAGRDPVRGFTAIGRAIDFALREIASNAFVGRQRKIDVSGDGRNNTGPPPFAYHDKARTLGVAINGLPIMTRTDNETAQLDLYYRDAVIVGPGAFVEVADDYADFARAFRRKLLREITPAISGAEPARAEGMALAP